MAKIINYFLSIKLEIYTTVVDLSFDYANTVFLQSNILLNFPKNPFQLIYMILFPAFWIFEVLLLCLTKLCTINILYVTASHKLHKN